MRLNLGCADRLIEGYLGVDIAPGPGVDIVADLSQRWPWADNEVDEVLALDVCEHIGDGYRVVDDLFAAIIPTPAKIVHYNGRIHFMNELHRVLCAGGRATIETPNATKGVGFAQDPTHQSHWCLSTFKYFEAGTFAHGRLSKLYGITAAFKVLHLSEMRSNGENPAEEVWKIRADLECVK